MSIRSITIPVVANGEDGFSIFTERVIELEGNDQRALSEQLLAENFRLRTSAPDYRSDFHAAGDPTLIVILEGRFRLSLITGQSLEFSPGELFIAMDFLPDEVTNAQFGHRGEVVGDQEFRALHLKLARR